MTKRTSISTRPCTIITSKSWRKPSSQNWWETLNLEMRRSMPFTRHSQKRKSTTSKLMSTLWMLCSLSLTSTSSRRRCLRWRRQLMILRVLATLMSIWPTHFWMRIRILTNNMPSGKSLVKKISPSGMSSRTWRNSRMVTRLTYGRGSNPTHLWILFTSRRHLRA